MGVRDVDNLMREMAAKWESLDPDFKDPDIPEEIRNLFVGVFNDHCRVFGYTLLSELPELLRGVLRDYERVEGIDYDLMLVDEYQDLNACDLEVLRRLGAASRSLVWAMTTSPSTRSGRHTRRVFGGSRTITWERLSTTLRSVTG
ncbi:MAG: hypothetical protein M5U18_04345 [Dehalococcoidia bacterium]|nr:hypothetical protein [Dehalococcoidia bacterium]